MILQKTEITFRTYEEAIQKTEVLNKDSQFTVYQLGLSGEIGELLTEIKKDKLGMLEILSILKLFARSWEIVSGILHKCAGWWMAVFIRLLDLMIIVVSM